ncbi:nitroreductase/quinone reductase family protein [Isoptericola sp. b441]|uniref:Nitroreductase/quinone reductase family protein n=1 Tax=Actinotalea lenta TaxID=3064654 RepID=A0ABT9D5G6_9CELL|nr:MULTISPECIES: nitroreductase/quinone reductase family protein [unclassified Isoptericola]MDO8106021.1 nitroreductase/quinone reductase family protein [Isoptericola sp. b441]MDO8122260.1 nitroreductase/quinone reductase family protein [Isoptericola sp. b490]
MNVVHRALIAVSFGRLGWRLGGTPALELTTVGRRSGEPRSTMLTAPMRVGDGLVVVASRGGDDRHPAWFLNLRENPEVTVRLEGRAPERRRARVMSDEERAERWPELIRSHTQYAGYQRKTDRVIPLVVLEPVGDDPGA